MFAKISKLLITIIIFLVTTILLNTSINFKNWFNKNVINKNFSFTYIAQKYEDLFGHGMPFKKYLVEPVFNEKLKYSSKEKYNSGVLLNLENNLVPSLGEGLVVFIGNKDDQKCITVEEIEHDVIYCMFESFGVSLYDHVQKGTYLGEVQSKLVLYFIKNGEYLDYEKFI